MTTPLSDNLVAPLLLELRDCLCAELRNTPSGPVCRCMVVHSATLPVMDGCDCTCEPAGQGDAWTRLVRLEPDLAIVNAAPQQCPSGWQAVIELGVYRCVETPEEGEALEPQVVNDTALRMLADMNAVLRTLCCRALTDRDLSVDFWQPIGPEGGCAGGALQIRVALPGGPGGC